MSTETPSTTRKSSAVFGLGNAITQEDALMTGIQRSTCRQVLRCLMYYIGEAVVDKRLGCTSAPPKWESSKRLLSQVTTFYQKANIPTVFDHQACVKMVKLLDANAKLRAIPVARRSTPATLCKLYDMQ